MTQKISDCGCGNCVPEENKYGFLKQTITLGSNKSPLTEEIIKQWMVEASKWDGVGKENLSSIHPNEKIRTLIDTLNQNLVTLSRDNSTPKMVALLSDTLYDIENGNYFGPQNRMMAHLILNYMAAYVQNPLLIFAPKEHDTYLEAIHDKFSTRKMLASKVKETCIINGTLFKSTGSSGSTVFYAEADYSKPTQADSSAPTQSVEWHQLTWALRQWKKDLS